MADGSFKKCPACGGSGECRACGGTGGAPCECTCGHQHDAVCWDCGNTGKCQDCEGKGRFPKTDFDLEAEGQMNLLQTEVTDAA